MGTKLGFALLVGALIACGSSDEPGAADASSVDAPPQATWDSFAADFLDTYCFECHGPGDAMRDYSVRAMVEAESDKIRCGTAPAGEPPSGCSGSISPGQFPIGSGPRPSDEDRRQLVRWIDEGMP